MENKAPSPPPSPPSRPPSEATPKKRVRKPLHRFAKHQTALLIAHYRTGDYWPQKDIRERFAAMFDVEPRKVQVWFQNQRAKNSHTRKTVARKPTAVPAELVESDRPVIDHVKETFPEVVLATLCRNSKSKKSRTKRDRIFGDRNNISDADGTLNLRSTKRSKSTRHLRSQILDDHLKKTSSLVEQEQPQQAIHQQPHQQPQQQPQLLKAKAPRKRSRRSQLVWIPKSQSQPHRGGVGKKQKKKSERIFDRAMRKTPPSLEGRDCPPPRPSSPYSRVNNVLDPFLWYHHHQDLPFDRDDVWGDILMRKVPADFTLHDVYKTDEIPWVFESMEFQENYYDYDYDQESEFMTQIIDDSSLHPLSLSVICEMSDKK